MPKIAIFAGSTRTGSINQQFADAIAKLAEDAGAKVTSLSLEDYPMPIYNGDWEAENGQPKAAQELIDVLMAHDGVFIVTPEYNGGLPALLKNTIDWTTRIGTDHFKGPVYGVAAASPGATAGIMAMKDLAFLLRRLGAVVIPAQVGLGMAGSAYEKNGDLKDGRSKDFAKAAIAQMLKLIG